MKLIQTIVIVFLSVAAVGACGGEKTSSVPLVGFVEFVKGDAQLERAGKKTALKKDEKIGEGDTIHTGANALVIAVFNNNVADVEIQENASLNITKFADQSKELTLAKGDLWLRVSKRKEGEDFRLRSPTAIAGVRGTKFFTFKIPDPRGRAGMDIHGTCHCEGKVDYEVPEQQYKKTHDQDFVVLTRGGKTVMLSAADMGFMANAGGHRHSKLEASRLGPQAVDITPDQAKQLFALVEKKFAATK